MHVDKILEKLKTHYPDLEIKSKQKSILMKLFNLVLFFVPGFMDKYITVIGSTIYLPDNRLKLIEANNHKVLPIIFHELMHMSDERSEGSLKFKLKYLFPQILSLLTPLCFFLLGFKGLLCLLFLLPLPAYFRKAYEERGYLTSLYVMKKLNDGGASYDIDKSAEYYFQYFSSPTYYFMWTLPWFKKDFLKKVNNIKEGSHPFDSDFFNLVDEVLK